VSNAVPTANKTILVVEDDADTRVAIAEVLEDAGYVVAHASNGAEATTYLHENGSPVCIVLDLMMPVMDGWTFAGELRKPGAPKIPVVVVTAARFPLGLPDQARHFLRKPLGPHALLAMVEDAIVGGGASS
jgi:CheY-like chemotaxis protein